MHRPEGVRGPGLRVQGGLVVGVACAAAMAVAAVQLAGVDAALGTPAAPDRRFARYRAGDLHDAAAAGAARAALVDRPVDGAAYRVLARQAQAEGDGPRAVGLLAAALRHWPRDVPGRALAADTALRAGDHATAWYHLDALMRAEPQLAGSVLAATVPALTTSAARDALIGRLAADPPWRPALPHALRADGLPWTDVDAFWSRLEQAGPLAPAEVAAHVHALEQRGQPQAARARWLRSLGTHAAPPVFDGGFDAPDATGPYAWSRPEVPGVELAYERASGRGALVAHFSGRAGQFAGPAQLLVLAPGDYRLVARADNRTSSTRPFEWRVDCLPRGPRLATLALRAQGDGEVAIGFTVPAGCTRQRIELRHHARHVGEQVVSGSLHLHAVGIVPSP